MTRQNCCLNPCAENKSNMLKNYLRKFFAASFYPTNSDDWYKSKGYDGQDSLEQFSQFLFSQGQEGAVFYDEFKSLNLKRQFIQSGEYKLDSVLLIPKNLTSRTELPHTPPQVPRSVIPGSGPGSSYSPPRSVIPDLIRDLRKWKEILKQVQDDGVLVQDERITASSSQASLYPHPGLDPGSSKAEGDSDICVRDDLLEKRYRHPELDSGSSEVEKKMFSTRNAEGLCFVFFQGRGEFYESRFRDMAIQARETGASVLGFNPKGFRSSTGRTEKIFDIVDDGIAVIKYLLDQMHLKPWQIVLQGNSLGAGVQEMVTEHFRKLYGFRFRQINSNSFKTLAAVLAYNYQVPFLERVIRLVLLYAQWEIVPGKDFYKTGPYHCHLRRRNDRTIAIGAEYNINVDIESDCAECPAGYRQTNRWLYENCQLVYNGNSETDPHFLSLHYFDLPGEEGKGKHSVYSFINRYLEESEKYI